MKALHKEGERWGRDIVQLMAELSAEFGTTLRAEGKRVLVETLV